MAFVFNDISKTVPKPKAVEFYCSNHLWITQIPQLAATQVIISIVMNFDGGKYTVRTLAHTVLLPVPYPIWKSRLNDLQCGSF